MDMTTVFDLGGVLVPTDGATSAVSASLGRPETEVAPAYWAFRDDYDRGGELADFWSAVLAEVGVPGDPEALDAIDCARWSTPAPGVVELIADLDAAGSRVVVLSNAPRSLAATVRAAAWSRGIDQLVFSSDLGLMKPDPAVYAAAEQAYGCRPSELVFFDDRPVNVAGARAAGWGAHLWAGVPAARELLGLSAR
jgi:putative hydrolase of the HAD superfamily